jgi:WD40 repeat protein
MAEPTPVRVAALLLLLGLCPTASAADPPKPLVTIPLGANDPKERRDVQWLAFLPTGDRVAVRTALPTKGERRDAAVEVYDTRAGKLLASATIPFGGEPFMQGPVPGCAVSPNGDWIAYGDGKLKFLAVPPHEPKLPGDGKVQFKFPGTATSRASVWVGPGNVIYALDGDWFFGQFSLYDWVPGVGVKAPESRALITSEEANRTFTVAAMNPTAGRFALAVGKFDKWVIESWELGPKPKKETIAMKVLPTALAIAPKGKTLLVGLADGSVEWYETGTGKRVLRLALGQNSVVSVAFHPDGQLVACGTNDDKGRVNLYCLDLTNGEMIAKVAVNQRSVSALAFSPDGKQLATFGAGELKIWETAAILNK